MRTIFLQVPRSPKPHTAQQPQPAASTPACRCRERFVGSIGAQAVVVGGKFGDDQGNPEFPGREVREGHMCRDGTGWRGQRRQVPADDTICYMPPRALHCRSTALFEFPAQVTTEHSRLIAVYRVSDHHIRAVSASCSTTAVQTAGTAQRPAISECVLGM